ncbi:MAG: hypothetical protein EOQ92_22140 [Mesorhizobium sp.]|nr:MAG: hypothetical protein EOQ92_22140 [Mesorhizobium sp.]RWK50650.1 MAG: hypothetical protein EOR47_09905 [Mesorhizobium sp.]RWK94145.1 MAG: hypothetical protein EOR53_19945 [Mesorhizobium sp.]RWL10714.1 MAG: hypothetical protein EOR45_07170 [Mesorhizobium sp.]TIQ20423.1 MAG: hypothetical protein E5X51_16090 [Mesorhizobium sp.]
MRKARRSKGRANLPLVGEMPGRAEGGAVPPTSQLIMVAFSGQSRVLQGEQGRRSFAPPSVLPDISPTRGEIAASPSGPTRRRHKRLCRPRPSPRALAEATGALGVST